MTDRAVRGTLAATVLFGVLYLLAVPLVRPEQVGVATDVYYHAGEALLSGRDPYAVTPPAHPTFSYVYPPVVLLAFLPHVLTGSPLGAYLLQTLATLATAGLLAVVVVRSITDAGVALATRDRLLIGAVVVGSIHSVPVLAMGQVNLQLALLVAVGARSLAEEREALAGSAFALAASVKLFPAVVGVWLLRLRAWRAVAAAVATGLGTVLVGVLAFGPAATRTFFAAVLPAERQADTFAGGLPAGEMFVSVRRPLAALFPGLGADALAVLGLAVLVPVVAAAARDTASETGRQVALLAVLLATLSYLPLEPFYYSLLYYPLLVLLFTLDPGRVRRVFLAGTLCLSAVVSYPSVERGLALAPLPAGTAATLEGLVRTAFSVAQPPLLGALLLLAGCVYWQHERARAAGPAAEAPVTK